MLDSALLFSSSSSPPPPPPPPPPPLPPPPPPPVRGAVSGPFQYGGVPGSDPQSEASCGHPARCDGRQGQGASPTPSPSVESTVWASLPTWPR